MFPNSEISSDKMRSNNEHEMEMGDNNSEINYSDKKEIMDIGKRLQLRYQVSLRIVMFGQKLLLFQG